MKRVFEISRLGDGTGLKLAGELDLHSAPKLTAALTAFQEGVADSSATEHPARFVRCLPASKSVEFEAFHCQQ